MAYLTREENVRGCRVLDPPRLRARGVPTVIMDQHSRRNIIECNTAKTHSVSSDDEDSTTGNNTKIRASNHKVKRSRRGTLIDRGANGGILGNDAIVIFKRDKTVDVTGIDCWKTLLH